MESVWLIVILLAAAMVLILLEVLTPSFGVLGLLAVAALAGAVYLAFRIGAWAGAITAAGVVLLAPAYCVLLARKLPNSPLGRVFLRKAPPVEGPDHPPPAKAALVGKSGLAVSPLHPCGTVRIAGGRYAARAESDYIDEGATVKVVRFDGMEFIVRRAEGAGAGPSNLAGDAKPAERKDS